MAAIDYRFFKRCPKRGKIVGINQKSVWYRLFFPIIGLLALIWFLVRVIPKPSRAAYPCQQIAAPLAISFVASIGAGAGILVVSRNILAYVKQQWLSSMQIAVVALTLGTMISTSCLIDYRVTNTTPWGTNTTIAGSSTTSTVDAVTSPSQEDGQADMGNYIAQTAADPSSLDVTNYGSNDSTVTWAHNPKAARWDGSGVWWSDNFVNHADVNLMFSSSLQTMTAKATDEDAWDTIFKNYQAKKSLPQNGYTAGESIAIKLNMNGVDSNAYSGQGLFVSPAMVYALAKQLVTQAHVPADKITFYDATRFIPNIIYDKIKDDPQLTAIKFVAFSASTGRSAAAKDLAAPIYWSGTIENDPSKNDGEGRGEATAYLPTVATQATYLINFSSLKGHDLAGFTVTAKNWFGSIMAGTKSWAPDIAGIHPTVAARAYNVPGYADYPKRAAGDYNALVDLMAHPQLGGKTILYLVDALYSKKVQNGDVIFNSKWQRVEFKKDGQNWWPSSLLVSQDGVAIDSVGYDMLKAEPSIVDVNLNLPSGNTADNYLNEAANASTTVTEYDPSNSGTRAPNLGNRVSWP